MNVNSMQYIYEIKKTIQLKISTQLEFNEMRQMPRVPGTHGQSIITNKKHIPFKFFEQVINFNLVFL